MPSTTAVTVRPYWYAYAQKEEIEHQCTDLLQLGVIQPSELAFSAPVLLVKKHDDSWGMCVDYRGLNDKTIKDKCPIPVIEELLDEVWGAAFFTRLDLHMRYHQVLMHLDNIEKTTFRMHQGLFEFLVMPLGLSNAPVMFQALMNEVLQPFLRRFILVFFDDILIYNASWSEHHQHIRLVFEKLQEHQLFLKSSKCYFGEHHVAYLSHIISVVGVAMDKHKVQSILSWPVLALVQAVRAFIDLLGTTVDSSETSVPLSHP
jgi:hypothetical protein